MSSDVTKEVPYDTVLTLPLFKVISFFVLVKRLCKHKLTLTKSLAHKLEHVSLTQMHLVFANIVLVCASHSTINVDMICAPLRYLKALYTVFCKKYQN